jgi:hypothetical protein
MKAKQYYFICFVLVGIFLWIGSQESHAQWTEADQAELDAKIEKRKALAGYEIDGSVNEAWALSQLENRAAAEPFGSLVNRGFRSVNAAVGIYQWSKRAAIDPDPNFDISQHEYLMQDIPIELRSSFEGVHSVDEGFLLRQEIAYGIEDLAILSIPLPNRNEQGYMKKYMIFINNYN